MFGRTTLQSSPIGWDYDSSARSNQKLIGKAEILDTLCIENEGTSQDCNHFIGWHGILGKKQVCDHALVSVRTNERDLFPNPLVVIRSGFQSRVEICLVVRVQRTIGLKNFVADRPFQLVIA